MLILSVYNEVKQSTYIIRYIAEENHPAFETNTNRSSRGQLQLASTLIRDPQGQLKLALTLPDTPQRPMPVREEDITGTQQEKCNSDNNSEAVRAKRTGTHVRTSHLIWSSKSQKTQTYIKETSECHQGDELSLCPRRKKDNHGGVGLTYMTRYYRLKVFLIIPTLLMQRRAGK